MQTKLSVNVNKVATLRNSRGGGVPSVLDAVAVCVELGAPGITIHPRADARHITRADARDIARALAPLRGRVEYNIEGDPRPDWIELVHELKPDQATIVPVLPGEITSQAGWTRDNAIEALPEVIARFKQDGIRVSLFIDPVLEVVEWAATTGADRVELYTEPFARAYERGPAEAQASFDRYAAAAERAKARGLGVNAGHDLDLDNLTMFRTLPNLLEVSIGHALISRAVFVGLGRVVREYLDVLAAGGPSRQEKRA